MTLQIGKLKPRRKKSVGFTPLEKLKCRNYRTFLTGFTLIELLLVVAILLILAGLNIPALSKTYNRLKIENCALNILSICRYAREKAIVESQIHRLNFDLNDKVYWISRETDRPGEFERINGRFSQNFKIPSGISIDVSSQQINFYPNAESDIATIILTDYSSLRLRLTKSGAFDEFEIKKEK